MLKHILTVLIAIGFFSAGAQESKMEPDRPSESLTPEITGKGYLLTEIGLRKEQENKEDYILYHPTVDLKLGVSKRVEIRAEITSASEKLYSKNEFNYGLKPIELGLKANLIEGKEAIPQTSLYAQFGFPKLASKDLQVEHIFPELRLLFKNEISNKISLNYNLGAEWNGENTTPQWVYTLSPQFEISNKCEVFVEEYSYFQKGEKPQHQIDGGLAYFLGNNVMWDISAGTGLSREASDYFIETGISFRIKP